MNNIIKEDLSVIYGSDLNWSEFKNKTFLITGSTGLISSYLVYTLMYLNKIDNANIKIIAPVRDLLKMSSKFFELLGNNNFLPVLSDISRHMVVDGNIDYIIHAASPAASNHYATNPLSVFNANVTATKNLLELAKAHNTKRFMFVSSGEVSGKITENSSCPNHYLSELDINELEYGELDPLEPRNIYAESKRMGEALCVAYTRQFGINTVIVRPDHTYSPTMDLKNDKRVFAEFVSNIVNHEPIKLKSNGSATRTFTYITDTIDGIFRVLLKGNTAEAYNISNAAGRTSILNLANMLADTFNTKVVYEKRTGDYIENPDTQRPSLCTAKLEQLGYRPKVLLKEGFSRTVKSFQ
jgi:nucleoside-diphosphate-sugar epimerase